MLSPGPLRLVEAGIPHSQLLLQQESSGWEGHTPPGGWVSDSGDRWGNWACPRVWAGQTGLCSDCWELGGGGEGWGLGVEQGSSSPTPLPVSGQEREQHGR